VVKLPTWMRGALFATAVMNTFAAIGFLPSAGAMRARAGLPEADHPLYLAMTSMFVLLFGFAYFWCAIMNRGDRLVLSLGAVGKLTFFTMLVWFWAIGELPFRAPLMGTADLIFAVLFLKWLLSTRAALPAGGELSAMFRR
jgi:hypothetical protein